MVGESIRRLIPSDRQCEEDDIIRRVSAGEIVPKFETFRLTRNGELIPLAVTISPIRDETGRVVGASKIANDLRDQEKLRDELRHSQIQFEALAQNIPQLAWMADGEGWIFWYNRRWFDYTGTALEDMQGWGWKAVHHPDHVDRVVDLISKCFQTGEIWEDTFPLRRHDGEYRWFLSRANPIKNSDGKVLLWCGTNTDITEQLEASERIKLLVGEVNHRSRNMLATIQAVANRTIGRADKDLLEGFSRRIHALSANQSLLTDHDWTGAPVQDLIHSQLLHVSDVSDTQISLDGPEGLFLRPRAAEALGLALHELATNAAKYGALSTPEGRVEISWKIDPAEKSHPADEGGRFTFDWRELDGPPVTPPEKKGFGTRIIEANPRLSMGAETRIDYAPRGLTWHLEAPCKLVIAEEREEWPPSLSD